MLPIRSILPFVHVICAQSASFIYKSVKIRGSLENSEIFQCLTVPARADLPFSRTEKNLFRCKFASWFSAKPDRNRNFREIPLNANSRTIRTIRINRKYSSYFGRGDRFQCAMPDLKVEVSPHSFRGINSRVYPHHHRLWDSGVYAVAVRHCNVITIALIR